MFDLPLSRSKGADIHPRGCPLCSSVRISSSGQNHKLAGENPCDHFRYKRKEIGCKYYWEDGIRLNAYGDTDRFLVEVDDKLGVPKHQLQDY